MSTLCRTDHNIQTCVTCPYAAAVLANIDRQWILCRSLLIVARPE